MKKIIYLLAVAVCQMMAMAASAQNLSGKWLLENTAENLGYGIEMHISGNYAFDNTGNVKASYRVITVMSRPDNDDNNVKSMYLDLLIDGIGKYSIADGAIHINLDKVENSCKAGEGTYENMGPEFKDKDPKGQEIFDSFLGVFVKLVSFGFKDVDIKDASIGETNIEGTLITPLMSSHVTLTQIDRL